MTFPSAPTGSAGDTLSFWNQLLEKTRLQTSLFRGARPKGGPELAVKQGALRWSFVVGPDSSLVVLQIAERPSSEGQPDADSGEAIAGNLLAHRREIELACGARLIWRQGRADDEPALVIIWRVEDFGPSTTGDQIALVDGLVDAMTRLYGACRPYLMGQVAGRAPEPAAETDVALLAQRFTDEMITAYYLLGEETGYEATQLMGSVRRDGGVGATRRLLRAARSQEELEALRKMRRLELSAEAFALREEYASLFTEDEREIARQRLRSHGYPV